MAKSEKPTAVEAPPTPPAPSAEPAAPQIQIEDGNILGTYSNFCRVVGTPEELLIDFGLNPQAVGIPTEPIKVTQRLIVNFFTAKRLLGALSMAVQRHESAFGTLETDIQKRLR